MDRDVDGHVVEYDNIVVDEDFGFEEVEYNDEDAAEDGEFDGGECNDEDGKFDGGEYNDENGSGDVCGHKYWNTDTNNNGSDVESLEWSSDNLNESIFSN